MSFRQLSEANPEQMFSAVKLKKKSYYFRGMCPFIHTSKLKNSRYFSGIRPFIHTSKLKKFSLFQRNVSIYPHFFSSTYGNIGFAIIVIKIVSVANKTFFQCHSLMVFLWNVLQSSSACCFSIKEKYLQNYWSKDTYLRQYGSDYGFIEKRPSGPQLSCYRHISLSCVEC